MGLSIDGGIGGPAAAVRQGGGVRRARFRVGLAPRMKVLWSGNPGNDPAHVLSLYKCTRACIPFSHSLTRRAPSTTKFIPHSWIDYRRSLILQELFICQKLHLTLPHHSRLAAPRFSRTLPQHTFT